MPPLSSHQSAETTKLLLIGNSGAGKTGALASLAKAGYNVRVLDLDNGLDVLANLLSTDEKAAAKVQFVTLTDEMRAMNGKLMPVKATVWSRAVGLLQEWKDGDQNLGSILSWGTQDILVIDSLTMLSNAALAFVLAMNGRLGQHPQLQDWGAGQSLIENLCQMLYDKGVKCNVIVCAHITYLGEEGGPTKGYPNTLGRALPPKIGRYFNTALMVQSVGQGTNIRRKILTNTSGVVELKNTAPLRVAPEYPIETGLADYFRAVRGS